jgi:hypothetical protein
MMPCFAIGDRPLEQFCKAWKRDRPERSPLPDDPRKFSDFRRVCERLFAFGSREAVAEPVAGERWSAFLLSHLAGLKRYDTVARRRATLHPSACARYWSCPLGLELIRCRGGGAATFELACHAKGRLAPASTLAFRPTPATARTSNWLAPTSCDTGRPIWALQLLAHHPKRSGWARAARLPRNTAIRKIRAKPGPAAD